MGAIDKFLNNLNLGGSDSADDYYDDYDDEEVEVQPKKFNKAKTEEGNKFSKVTSIGKKKVTPNASYEINVVKPKTMEDSKEITNSLIENMAVLLNLTNVDIDLARRVLDFAMGTTYALNGSLQKITESIFVIVPDGVDISGALGMDDESEE